MMSDSPRATASDSLSGTDVMAAMGMAQSQAGIDIHLVGKFEWFHCWRMTKDERVRAFDFFHDPVL